MKRRFTQWGLCSGIVAVVSLLGLLLFDQEVFSVFELLLRPWFGLCRAITPNPWEVQGNILLGLMWMISGILVYCILFGATATLLLSAFERRRNKGAANHTAPDSRSRFRLRAAVILAVGLVLAILQTLWLMAPIWEDESGSDPVQPEEAVSDVAWRLTRWMLSEESYFEKHMEVHGNLSSGLTCKVGYTKREGWPHYEDGEDWYALELTEALAATLRQSLPHSLLIENVPHLLNEIPVRDDRWPKTWPDDTACYAPIDREGSWDCLIIPPQGLEAWFYREAH